jgi:hypothetical protein
VLADVSHVLDAAVLRRLDQVRPDVVQVDVSKPCATGAEVRQLLDWAATHGAQVHATGVDLEPRKALAVELGAIAGRGRLLGAPGAL